MTTYDAPVRDIQFGAIPDWFEVISDFDNRPDKELGLDVGWFGKMGSYDVYRLLHRLQGRYIPSPFGVVRICPTPEPTPLHPITDAVQGVVLEYIPGVSMEKPKPGMYVSEQEAERISSDVMAGPCAIEAENCLLHNNRSFCGKGTGLPSSSTLERPTLGS
ncbi:hypothetical protein ARMSODRAFT_447780 [Armillaria solidipes]|uniref:Uncharacterized protein n=1 Tax=Armillaria solidipes TaxID=1076256 RepID=A0A2H3B2R5_9AGAR|nr:hypothetical protein ARMSODRAFT_447780 [Armillaria solidipes]